jgi:DNA-binding beta-propeller fold protein YncE
MNKLTVRSCNSRNRKILCFWVIFAICVVLLCPWPPAQSSLAEQKTDIPRESGSADQPKQTGSDRAEEDEGKPKNISCLFIMRQDYQGGNLSYPSKLFFDSVKKEIYVTDSGHGRILVYTHDFYPLLTIGKSDGIETPMGIAVDPEGYLFVAQSPGAEHTRGRISVYTPALKWKKNIFFEGFKDAANFRPTNIALDKTGRLYVAGSNYLGAVVLDKDGVFSNILTPVDSIGKLEKREAEICDVDIDDVGNIYLLSEEMGRIYVYDQKENFLFKFGTKGGSSGKLSRPRGLAVDDRGKRVYVIDYMRHTANAYSADGRFLFEFGGQGWGRGWFQYPSDIAVDASGNVLVADTFNNRVQVFGFR